MTIKEAEKVVNLHKELTNLAELDNDSYTCSTFYMPISTNKKRPNTDKLIGVTFGGTHCPDASLDIPERYKGEIIDAIRSIYRKVEAELSEITNQK